MRRLAIILLLALLIAGCGGAAPVAPAAADTPSLTVAAPAPTGTPEGSGVAPALAPPTALDDLPAWLTATSDAIGADSAALRESAQALSAAGFIASEAEWRQADLTGDGVDEWLLLVQDPLSEERAWGRPGAILVIGRSSVPSTLLYRGGDGDEWSAPAWVGVGDVTGDQVDDLVYEVTSCGANTCFQAYHVVSWHGGSEPRELLSEGEEGMADAYSMSYSEGILEDRTGDRVLDLVLTGGTAGSVGAGPQRARTEVWRFDGEQMALAERVYQPSPLRYFRLLDANAAFDAGDLATAATLYDEALRDETLEASGYDLNNDSSISEEEAIRQYAAFRLLLIAQMEGEAARAGERLAAMQAAYPDSPVTAAAALLQQRLASGSDVAQACAAVRDSLAATPDATGPLAYMGYTNPELTADTLCPSP